MPHRFYATPRRAIDEFSERTAGRFARHESETPPPAHAPSLRFATGPRPAPSAAAPAARAHDVNVPIWPPNGEADAGWWRRGQTAGLWGSDRHRRAEDDRHRAAGEALAAAKERGEGGNLC